MNVQLRNELMFSVKQERDGQGLTRASWRELLSAKLSNGTCDLNSSEMATG